MLPNIDFIVSDQGQTRGPLRLEEVRRGISSGAIGPDAVFRVEGCKRFLPGAAWDPLSDLFTAPSPPDPPDGSALESLPRDLGKLDPQVRDKMLWFVEDTDGVMGPVTGAYVARGLMTGRIPIGGAVSLVSVPGWIRATAVFPAALESATAIRARPSFSTFPCPFCLEPVISGSASCMHCGETFVVGEAALGVRRTLTLVLAGALAVLAPLGISVATVRGEARAQATPTSSASAGGTASASGAPVTSAAPATSAAPSAETPPKARLEGQVAAKIDVAPDALDALLLPRGQVAVARRAAIDVVDPRSGVVVMSAREAAPARELSRVGDALYALGTSRVAVLDPETLRVLRFIDPRVPIASLVPGGGMALLASTVDRSVMVLGSAQHVELGRFRLLDDVPGALALEPSGALAAVAVADPHARGGSAALDLFVPSSPPGAQPLRRVALEGPVAAVAVERGGALVALRTSRLTWIGMGPSALLGPPSPGVETCAEPERVRFARERVLVGCRGGRALAMHDATTLEQKELVELGGPVTALDVSPDGSLALVATGAPSPGVFLVQVAEGKATRTPVADEVTAVRFGSDGSAATAFAAKARRVWVLR